MWLLYRDTALLAAKRAFKAWPVAFSLVAYAVVLTLAGGLTAALGPLRGLAMGLVVAACLASYVQLLEAAVAGTPIRWHILETGFRSRFSDAIGIVFAFFVIGWLASALLAPAAGSNGPAVIAILGVAMAFFFNAVPELLYQGQAGVRSFGLLAASARFMMAHAGAWLLPNLLFAVVLLLPAGLLRVRHPGEAVLLLGTAFSPAGIAAAIASAPPWSWPLLLILVHYAMVFRGLLFGELGTFNPRMRAFRRAHGD